MIKQSDKTGQRVIKGLEYLLQSRFFPCNWLEDKLTEEGFIVCLTVKTCTCMNFQFPFRLCIRQR